MNESFVMFPWKAHEILEQMKVLQYFHSVRWQKKEEQTSFCHPLWQSTLLLFFFLRVSCSMFQGVPNGGKEKSSSIDSRHDVTWHFNQQSSHSRQNRTIWYCIFTGICHLKFTLRAEKGSVCHERVCQCSAARYNFWGKSPCKLLLENSTFGLVLKISKG